MPPRYVVRLQRIRGLGLEIIFDSLKRALIIGGPVGIIYLLVCMVRDWHVPAALAWFFHNITWISLLGFAAVVVFLYFAYGPGKDRLKNRKDPEPDQKPE